MSLHTSNFQHIYCEQLYGKASHIYTHICIYIHKQYSELQGCLPKLQRRCSQRKENKGIYKGRQSQCNSKQISEAEITSGMSFQTCKVLMFIDQGIIYETKLNVETTHTKKRSIIVFSNNCINWSLKSDMLVHIL